MNDRQRDSLLTELKTDMKWVKESLKNHLATHTRANIIAWSTAAGAILALIILILKLI